MATWDGSDQGDAPSEDYQRFSSDPERSKAGEHSWNYNDGLNDVTNRIQSSATPLDDAPATNIYQDITDTFTIEVPYDSPENCTFAFESCVKNEKFSSSDSRVQDSNDSGLKHVAVISSKLHPGANEFIPSGYFNIDTSRIFSDAVSDRSGKRGFDVERTRNVVKHQHEGVFQENAFGNNGKSRRNDISNQVFCFNTADHEIRQNDSDDIHKEHEEYADNGNLEVNSMQTTHEGLKTRSHGRFQNIRYSARRHFYEPNTLAPSGSNSFPERRNNPANDSKNIIHSCKSKEQSRRRYGSGRKTNDELQSGVYDGGFNMMHNRAGSKDKKRRGRGKQSTYSGDPRDERYVRNCSHGGKLSRNKRVNYQKSRDSISFECNSKLIDNPKSSHESSSHTVDGVTNWRRNTHPNQMERYFKRIDFDDVASQRERLTDQLNRGYLECLVCCEYIKQNDAIWSCDNCYHVLHLKCIKKWAELSQGECGWRCPACQNVNRIIPQDYLCFCGKTRDPEWNRRDVAHSCGEVCGRGRTRNNCIHKCTLLCHPGSCPSCIVMVTRYCGCGVMSQSFKCSTDTQLSCNAVCGKLLNCQIHNCQRKCHHDNCGSCEQMVRQDCYCGKHNREILCRANTPTVYNCDEICDKELDCGNHNCKKECHPGACDGCSLKPELSTHCYCGQTLLNVQRQNCLESIPTCDKVCMKYLQCGPPGERHTCQSKCHPGDCPQCELTTWVKCRCGNMDREIPCANLTTKADDATCEKKCTKKRSCGRHKCNQLCCIDIEHICLLQCSKTLSCGKHKCDLTCHKGRCRPCYRSSFEELYCECGTAVIYPPVPCGTRRPTCNRPCSRQHSCGHEVLHNCHSELTCPPCTVLTQKWCYGKHELRKAVPCYFGEFSCGMPCGMPLVCGRHRCITLCHSGSCKNPGQRCTQSCITPREMCGHNCAAPCHDGKCPDIPCKEMVKVTCTCGNRSMTRACAENSREYRRIASGILASKMADMQLGQSVDLEEVFGQGAKKQNQLKTLECNEECKTIERNRKLALGLQIVNPDLSGKLLPRYTDFMKQWAKKDPIFCQMVHDKLTELVQLAKTSKQKSRSYSFDSMNRDKRHFVHEACEHFGCESQAYDQEPKRNVVATAIKDKCWLPSYSLLEMIQRENGQRKVPRPMLNIKKTSIPSSRISEVLPSTAKKSQKLQPIAAPKSWDQGNDYFDFPNSKWSYTGCD